MSDTKRKISQLPDTTEFASSDAVMLSKPIGGGVFQNKLIRKTAFLAALPSSPGGGYEPGDAFYLQSPNGHYWQLSIDNDGTLSYEDIGTVLP